MAKQKSKKKSSGIVVESNEFGEVTENTVNEIKSENVSESELDELLGDTELEKTEETTSVFPTKMTSEVKDKLEKFDNLEKHCLELETKNSELTDTIARYFEEIEELKSKNKELEKTSKTTSSNSKVEELETTIQELQDENESYLVKLSELSFENAKLVSELQLLEKKNQFDSLEIASSLKKDDSNLENPKIKNVDLTMKNDARYINPYLNNGYVSWN